MCTPCHVCTTGLVRRDNTAGPGHVGVYRLASLHWGLPFALSDEADLILDLLLAAKLFRQSEHAWGVLLLLASIASQALLYRGRALTNFYSHLAPINSTVAAVFELMAFMLKDHTTIIIFTAAGIAVFFFVFFFT